MSSGVGTASISKRVYLIYPYAAALAFSIIVPAFEPADEIRTEISAKFSHARLAADLGASGLEIVEVLSDPDDLFALVLARPVGEPGDGAR